ASMRALLLASDGLGINGRTGPSDALQRAFFWAKTDFSGNLQRFREYGVPGSVCRDAVIALPDSGYLLAGQTSTDAYLVRLGGDVAPPCPSPDSLVIKF